MSRSLRIVIFVTLLPFALVLWATVVFAMDRASNGGEVLGHVTVADVDLGGLSEDGATAAVERLEAQMGTEIIPVTIAGARFDLTPAQIGFTLETEAMVAEAMEHGRTGGISEQFRWWVGHFGSDSSSIELRGGYDRSLLRTALRSWESEAILDRPFEGAVVVENGQAVADYPRTGRGIDLDAAVALIESQLFLLQRQPVDVPITATTPQLTNADLDRAVTEANRLLGGPVTLTRVSPAVEVEFGVDVLAAALRSRIVGVDNPIIELYFDAEPFVGFIEPLREQLTFPPVDAQIVIRPDDVPSILPGRRGTLINDNSVVDAALQAARSVTRRGVFPFVEGTEPEFSTADAEALNINYLLYEATTFYLCCGDAANQGRIQNIQRIAEETNGAIVMPGEEFSLNGYVGQRTIEDGYARAGAIIGDNVYCCDHPANIGGGVSQFATTLYNAVFFSGLKDIEHTPHTLYFSRYPEGREATLGWPSPDVKFLNNTDAAVYIQTESTDTSVTVKFFGDNGGIEVGASLSGRRNFVDPFDSFEPDPEVPPGEVVEGPKGSVGWDVTVTRIITQPDGTETTEEWFWRYRPFPNVFYVHPCDLPEEDPDHVETCPMLVPDVLFKFPAAAQNSLNNAGFTMVIGDPIEVQNPDNEGKVVRQSPGAGELTEDSTVTVRLGVAPADD